ncbi:MAG: AcrR family transcriptional regulator [Reinekea sp.]|jgi:AcrR family transcriptional regulator|uniref:TetR/AcrR family transcriptional regulator n=2 Tax=Reinekea sp. TaxID=1970455 RepID=UPI00398A11A2
MNQSSGLAMESLKNLSQVLAPKTKRGEQTLEKILNAAEIEFGEKGFHEGSITGIAYRAGIAQGTFYLYFKCKEDVLRELVLYINRTIRSLLSESVINVEDRIEAERIGLRTFLTYIRKHPHLYRILQESQFVDPEVHKAYYMSFSEGYQQALKQAVDQESIRDGQLENWSWAIMGMMHFIGQRYIVWGDQAFTDESLDAVVDSIIDLLKFGLKR